MAKKEVAVKHYVHFECNGVTGFVEVLIDGAMFVMFAGERIIYSALKGRLKQVVHSVMVKFGFVSSWRG